MNAETQYEIEAACRQFTGLLTSNFQQYVRDKMVHISPFVVLFTEQGNESRISILPFSSRPTLIELASMIKAAIRQKGGVAFVVGYDGYTTFLSGQSKEGTTEKKDTIVVMWATSWGTRQLHAIRYESPEHSPVVFEAPIEQPDVLQHFQGIFT